MRPSVIGSWEVSPIAVNIRQAAQMIGRGCSTIYWLIASGDLEAIKSDNRSLVIVESLRAYVERCPRVKITPRPKRKPQHLRQAEIATAAEIAPPRKRGPPRRREPQRLRQAEIATAAVDNA
jgi:hypothetical protein